MQIQLDGNPDYGRATITLGPDETVLTESGAMSFIDPGLDLKARIVGGVPRALVRRILGNESFFLGEYRGPRGGRVGISPVLPVTVVHRTLAGE